MEEEFKNAILEGDLNKVRECLKNGVDPNKEYLVKYEYGINSTEIPYYPIQLASQYGHLEIVKLLLNDNRVDPCVEDNYSIKMASLYAHRDIIRELLTNKKVRDSLRKEDIKGLIEKEYKLFKLKKLNI